MLFDSSGTLPAHEEGRATKKVKKRREDLPPDDSMVSDNGGHHHLSFKETLMVGTSEDLCGSFGLDDEEELMLEEGDIVRESPNGIPTIKLSNRVEAMLEKRMANTVIIKLLGRKIGYKALWGKLKTIWRQETDFHLIDLDNDFFLVKFHSYEDYLRILSEGPWVIYGHYLTVQPWDPAFRTHQGMPTKVVAWVRFPGLPIHLYHKTILREIAAVIGRVIRIDYNTDAMQRGKFARMAVEVDLTKPLVAKVGIGNEFQRVEYEALPQICYECGRYGHSKDICPLKRTETVSMETTAPEKVEQTMIVESSEEGIYGPWMQVQRKGRKQQNPRPRNLSRAKEEIGGKMEVSNFNHLLEDVDKLSHLKADVLVKAADMIGEDEVVGQTEHVEGKDPGLSSPNGPPVQNISDKNKRGALADITNGRTEEPIESSGPMDFYEVNTTLDKTHHSVVKIISDPSPNCLKDNRDSRRPVTPRPSSSLGPKNVKLQLAGGGSRREKHKVQLAVKRGKITKHSTIASKENGNDMLETGSLEEYQEKDLNGHSPHKAIAL